MNKGKEQMVVIVLLVLFGFLTVLTLSEANNTYTRIMDTKSDLENVKIAASYIQTKLKQSDIKNTVRIGENLDIYEQEDVLTRIFVEEGILAEVLMFEGSEVEFKDAFKIAEIDSVDFFYDKEFNSISFVVKKGVEIIKGQVSFKTKAVRL